MKSIYTWEQVARIYESPHLLGHLCGKTLLTDLHSHWMKWGLNSNDKRGLLCHRGSYKTVSITEVGTIYCLMRNPEETICIVRKSFTLASEILKEVMQIMESPPIYYLLLHCWFADENNNIPKGAEWHFSTRKEGKLDLSIRKTHTKECSLNAYGLNGNFTGQHYSRLILDDVTSYADRIYDVEREFSIMMVNELMSNIINRGCPVTVVGTVWNSRDALMELEKQGMPFLRYPVSATGLMSEEQIAEAKRTQTGALYDCNYNLSFSSTEDMIFYTPHRGIWDKAHVKNVVAHVDAAYGGDDYTALTIAGKLPGEKINMVGFLFKGHIKDLAEEIFTKMAAYGAKELYMENNADKGFSLDSILGTPMARSFSIWGHSYNESLKKQVKISTYLYDRWGHIQWAEETDPDYLNQILDWTEMTKLHDDAADSAASLIREAGFSSVRDYRELYK